MNIYLYERRVLALERHFKEARRHLDRIDRQVRYNPKSVKRSVVKSQLDLINASIRITKEETAFFVRLGQLYDVMQLHVDFFEILSSRDPELMREILTQLAPKYGHTVKTDTVHRP